MTLQDFTGANNGKKLDWDGYYGAQCVDLYRFYLRDVLGVPQGAAVKGAADLWNTYRTQDFERIPNTPLGIPQPGDVMIWNRNVGAGYGHVAIVTSASLMWFEAFSQNDPAGSASHIKRYTYKNVYGWLRPRKAVPAPKLNDSQIMDRVRQIATDSTSPTDQKLKIRALVNE